MSKRKPTTAEDLMKELNADPDHMRRESDRSRKEADITRKLRDAEAPLVQDLKSVHIEVESVYDLVNTTKEYPEAIPVLVDHVTKDYPERIKEGIVRALRTKAARGKVSPQLLMDEFRHIGDTSETGVKAVIGDTISSLVDDSNFAELVDLIKDKKHGKARSGLPIGLTWMQERKDEAIDVLLDLLDDTNEWIGVQNAALEALGHLRPSRASPPIQRFINHHDPYVRRLARQASRVGRAKRNPP